jgi:hypothetical protein
MSYIAINLVSKIGAVENQLRRNIKKSENVERWNQNRQKK